MSFSFHIDWNRGGDSADSGDNVTGYVRRAKWRLGMLKPFDHMAAESTLVLDLHNESGRFNPENSSSPLYPNLKPNRRVQVLWNSTPMWRGWIEDIIPDTDPAGSSTNETTAQIRCTGAKRFLDALSADLSVYSDATGDVIAEDLAIKIPPPVTAGIWLAGLPGFSEAGETTFASDVSDITEIETGITTFGTFGDRPTASAWSSLRQITEAERGRFFFARDGKFTWWNRHHLLSITSNAGTVDYNGTIKPVKVDYRWGEALANIVTVRPAARGTTGSITLWTLDNSITVPDNGTREFYAYLTDADGEPVGAASVTASGATWSAGTGAVAIEELGHRVKVTLTNSTGAATTLTALSLTGTATDERNALEITEQDTDSIGTYGKKELRLSLNALTDLDEARAVAQFELRQRKEPQGVLNYVEFLNKADGADNAHQYTWEIGDRIAVNLQNGHSANHYIIGEEHEWRAGNMHRTKFFLEPAGSTQFWLAGVVGFSEAGVTTIAGY